MSGEGASPVNNSSSHNGTTTKMPKCQSGCCPLSFNVADTQVAFRLKCPKVIVGPVELGIAANYSLDGIADDKDEKLPALLVKRLKPTLTVKDTLLRGKLEVEPQNRKVHYSKKFRLPFANTELLRLRLTAQWPTQEAAGGLLGRALGLTFSFEPERLHKQTVVAAVPKYSLQLKQRVGPPQLMYDAIGFPGSVYLKTDSTLTLSDAASVNGLRAHLDVHRVSAVVRLYDPARIKPCTLGRSLAKAARQLTAEEVDAAVAVEKPRPVVKVVKAHASSEMLGEPHTPDAIDRAAAKVREWTYAVMVNSCVASEHLRQQANMAGERLKALLAAKGDGAVATAAPAAEHADAGKSKSRCKRC